MTKRSDVGRALALVVTVASAPASAQAPRSGADEATPAKAEYFTWINNTTEGPTEAQTLVNLAFFEWIRAEYGMQLDLYAFDAGAIDGAGYYGDVRSRKFQTQFPRGFGPIAEKAGALGMRLGLWGGPDGFGVTPAQERARRDLLVSLCRDFKFGLFKFDGVCGPLRPDKRAAFAETMAACRASTPDLIVLNHRLDLGPEGAKHATTALWQSAETYIDVHMTNAVTAPHHRAAALARGHTPGLSRLMEDHGVCLSSAMDFWEDDLVVHAFGRGLVVSPQIYGNPWLLRDDELPRLARLFNLHRKHRGLLVRGVSLPEAQYGPFAVSRGDEGTRLVVLQNLGWTPVRRRIELGSGIGLGGGSPVTLRQLHPTERVLGTFPAGSTAEVEVLPFRAALLLASTGAEAGSPDEPVVLGTDYAVVRDVPGKPVVIELLGQPGAAPQVSLAAGGRRFSRATIAGVAAPALLAGKPVAVRFPGAPLRGPWHRKLGDLAPAPVPPDAEALYEATVFAADNDALEVRSLRRAGETKVPAVAAARKAFLEQPLFVERGLWDRYLFDGDPRTGYYVCRRWPAEQRVHGGGFRLDFGAPVRLDRLELDVGGEYELQPFKDTEAIPAQVSADLRTWTPIQLIGGKQIVGDLALDRPVRYLRIPRGPDRVNEVRASFRGRPLDRARWRGSNLFAAYGSGRPQPFVARRAFSLRVRLPDAAPGAYLAVAVNGTHGREGAYAALRVAGRPVGAPDRSPSYPSNVWEAPVRGSDRNYTYYFPVDPAWVGKEIDVVVLGTSRDEAPLAPEAWVTSYPGPHVGKTLVLE